MTILVYPDPTPTGLRISAYRPPESGYARLVPNTWYNSNASPSYVDGHRLRTMNTGWGPIWEAGSPAISTGSVITVPWRTFDVSSGGMGSVTESGGLYESGAQAAAGKGDRWCCTCEYNFCAGWFCDASDCAKLDQKAAEEFAAASGGGIVVDKDGNPVSVVTGEDTWSTWGPPVLEPGDDGFEEAVEVATAQKKPKIKKQKGGKPTVEPPLGTPPSSAPGTWSPPPGDVAFAHAGLNATTVIAGLALVGAAYYFMGRK
jgi:hypothetical protein